MMFLVPGGNTGIDKRHFHLTEETLAAHPELLDPELPRGAAGAGLRSSLSPWAKRQPSP